VLLEDGSTSSSTARPAERGDAQGAMRDGFAVVEDFFGEAEEVRAAIDGHFAEPQRHQPDRHQIWNYWFVPGLYTYLRTLPEKVIAPELAHRFFHHLQRYAFETFGLGTVYWPYLSVYVAGCYQGLHNDAKNGRLGYVYSLTRWDKRRFSGGETLLLKEDSWSETGSVAKAKAGTGFYRLIPQQFNQLLVFDDRIPHAVQRIEGTMDPIEGRIAIHGHLAEAGVTVEGGLGGEQIHPVLARLLAEVKRRQEKNADRYHGLVVTRLSVDSNGRVAPASVLLDRVLPLRRDVPLFKVSGFIDLLSNWRFPATHNASRITIPIVIGAPIA
jgi:hypothetical protein